MRSAESEKERNVQKETEMPPSRCDCLITVWRNEGNERTIVGVKDSNLAVGADLHPVAHVEGRLPVDGMQHQEGQRKVLHSTAEMS